MKTLRVGLLVVALMGVGAIFVLAGRRVAIKPQAAVVPTLAATPTPTPTPTIPPTTAVTEVPILMYHYIRDYHNPADKVGENLSISPQKFREQLDAIKGAGYTATTLDAFVEHKLPEKPVILTFDDGYADAYSAVFPALRERGMAATFYVITDYLDKPKYMTWEQVKEMAAAGMQIESHTLNHADLRKLSPDEQLRELVESKRVIEERLGTPVRHFCYPSGRYTEETLGLVKAAGYETATTVAPGVAKIGDDPYQLPRLRVLEQTNLAVVLGRGS